MPTLPQGSVLPPTVEITTQPSLTWYINKGTNRIQGECDNWLAVRQAVEIILNIERYKWQIYSPYTGMEWRGLIGEDAGYVASEIQRRARDALLMDDRVTGLTDYSYTISGSTISASFTVNTVYGEIPQTLEVNVN